MLQKIENVTFDNFKNCKENVKSSDAVDVTRHIMMPTFDVIAEGFGFPASSTLKRHPFCGMLSVRFFVGVDTLLLSDCEKNTVSIVSGCS